MISVISREFTVLAAGFSSVMGLYHTKRKALKNVLLFSLTTNANRDFYSSITYSRRFLVNKM